MWCTLYCVAMATFIINKNGRSNFKSAEEGDTNTIMDILDHFLIISILLNGYVI